MSVHLEASVVAHDLDGELRAPSEEEGTVALLGAPAAAGVRVAHDGAFVEARR